MSKGKNYASSRARLGAITNTESYRNRLVSPDEVVYPDPEKNQLYLRIFYKDVGGSGEYLYYVISQTYTHIVRFEDGREMRQSRARLRLEDHSFIDGSFLGEIKGSFEILLDNALNVLSLVGNTYVVQEVSS